MNLFQMLSMLLLMAYIQLKNDFIMEKEILKGLLKFVGAVVAATTAGTLAKKGSENIKSAPKNTSSSSK